MSDVAMPRLSDSMEEGTILKWLKSDGDEVSKGEELVEIETDKANMTYEADESGTLEIVALRGRHAAGRRDDRADRRGRRRSERGERGAEESERGRGRGGGARGRGGARRGRRTTRTTARKTKSEPDEEEPEAEEPDAEPEPEPDDDRVKASPIARRMAREKGLDLSEIEGSGPGGRIVKSDIEAARAARSGEEEPEAEEAPDGGAQGEEAPKPAARTAAAATSPTPSSAGCSARSRAGWRSPRPPRRTS